MIAGGDDLAVGPVGTKPLKEFDLQWLVGRPSWGEVAEWLSEIVHFDLAPVVDHGTVSPFRCCFKSIVTLTTALCKGKVLPTKLRELINFSSSPSRVVRENGEGYKCHRNEK